MPDNVSVPNNLLSALDNVRQSDEAVIAAQKQYEDEWLAAVKNRVTHIYEEDDERKLQGLIALESIRSARIARQSMATIEVVTLYYAYKNVLFHQMGFSTLEEWLDSAGLLGGGRENQLRAIATIIIPWCERNRVVVNGRPVNIDWIRRYIGPRRNKSVASRLRHGVSQIKKFIKSDAPLDKKIEAVTQVMTWVDDPTIGNEKLRKQLLVNPPPSKEIKQSVYKLANGNYQIVMEVNPEQFDWMERQLGAASVLDKMPAALYYDGGLVWVDARAFQI